MAVKAALPQLRLAKRIEAAVPAIALQHVEDRGAYTKGLRELRGMDKFQVVRRSVIFGESSPHTAHQAPNRQIESGRAVLPLVVAVRRKLQKLCQVRGDCKAQQIVVCQRRMTHMTRNQDLVGRASRKIAFSQSQASVHESRINTNFILAVFERLQLIVSNTKTPIFFVVGRAIWTPVGLLRNTEEVRPEFLQRHSCVHGNAVIHNVQIAFLKFDEAFSVGALEECIAVVLLPWYA